MPIPHKTRVGTFTTKGFKPERDKRKIRFATNQNVKEAAEWVARAYSEVLRKLKD